MTENCPLLNGWVYNVSSYKSEHNLFQSFGKPTYIENLSIISLTKFDSLMSVASLVEVKSSLY